MARMTPRQIDRAFAQQPDEDENVLAFEPADESCFPDEETSDDMQDDWYERNLAWESDSYNSDFSDSDFE